MNKPPLFANVEQLHATIDRCFRMRRIPQLLFTQADGVDLIGRNVFHSKEIRYRDLAA